MCSKTHDKIWSGIKCRNSVSYIPLHMCMLAIYCNIALQTVLQYCAKYFDGPHTFGALFALIKQQDTLVSYR